MKTFIQNRHGEQLCVVLEPGTSGKLTFVMHGLGGNKDELQLRAVAEAFLELDHTAITFDTRNTFGESAGKYEEATLTGYYQDLEDVISWASQQPWYVEPFTLAGLSFGGISAGLFTQKYPEKIKALAPLSTPVSGELTLETPKSAPKSTYLTQWKAQGFWISPRRDGSEKRLNWACMEDRLKYSLLPDIDKLTMPVLLAVGEKDQNTPPEHHQILFAELPGTKEMHIIKNAVHTFNRPEEREELKQIVKTWAKKYS